MPNIKQQSKDYEDAGATKLKTPGKIQSKQTKKLNTSATSF